VSLTPAAALSNIPPGLRAELTTEFEKITRNYREGRWEAAELDGGRLCEIVYTILAGHLDGDNFPVAATKPAQFDAACKDLERKPKAAGSDSARVTLPRMLVPLYALRNKRGVGHVGGDVSSNYMDATVVLHMSQWIMAELVRIFHNVTVDEATSVVAALVDRTVPVLWKVGEVVRILDPSLGLEDGTLLLLYSEVQGVHEKKLAESQGQDKLANYRRVLRRLHDRRLIEYNETTRVAIISPTGVGKVESGLL
jgi:hypothetical protein